MESEPVVVKTYDKSGKQISKVRLDCGECGASLDLEWCSRTGIIKKDLAIFKVDTIKTAQQDSTLKAIEGTEAYYLISEEGRINGQGIITMSGVQRKDIGK